MTNPPLHPLAGQEALQRRLGLDDEAFNYLMANACHLADHLRETGSPPIACWLTTLLGIGLLGACTLTHSQSPNELADMLSEVIRENMPDALAIAVDFTRQHLPAEGGGGENALETAWDDRVNPENLTGIPGGIN